MSLQQVTRRRDPNVFAPFTLKECPSLSNSDPKEVRLPHIVLEPFKFSRSLLAAKEIHPFKIFRAAGYGGTCWCKESSRRRNLEERTSVFLRRRSIPSVKPSFYRNRGNKISTCCCRGIERGPRSLRVGFILLFRHGTRDRLSSFSSVFSFVSGLAALFCT